MRLLHSEYMKKTQWIGVGVLVVAVVAVGFLFVQRITQPQRADDGRVRVVTTFVPLFSATAQVAGTDADVENLLATGVGPHDYAFTPADIEKLQQADVVVMLGLGLDDWVREAVATANPSVRVIVASAGVPTDAATDEEEALEHGGIDPHIWLDPIRMQQITRTIAAGLTEADPTHAAGYGERSARFIADLEALDQDISTTLEPITDRRFVAYHSAFHYFADRYGLNQIAVLQISPGAEPSPRVVADTVDLIKREKVRAIFSEPQFSPQVIQLVARETGRTTHILDTLETGELSADIYVRVMRRNLDALRTALSTP